jgi:hypothetical protein
MQLTRAERIFLDFITEEMDEKNYISNSTLVRQKFNNLFKSTGQEPFTDNTIHRCFSGLAKVELLRKAKGRGLYQVNPLFHFKGSEEQRQKVIREQLEEINRIAINEYRQELLIQKAVSCDRERQSD